jgi:hypothetical protein
VPDNVTEEGLPVALCEMDRLADRLPVDPAGVNVTVTVCADAPAFTVNEVGLTENCAASVPDTVTEEIVNAAVPTLDTVNVC